MINSFFSTFSLPVWHNVFIALMHSLWLGLLFYLIMIGIIKRISAANPRKRYSFLIVIYLMFIISIIIAFSYLQFRDIDSMKNNAGSKNVPGSQISGSVNKSGRNIEAGKNVNVSYKLENKNSQTKDNDSFNSLSGESVSAGTSAVETSYNPKRVPLSQNKLSSFAILLWLCGVVIMLIRNISVHIGTKRGLSSASLLKDAAVLEIFESILTSMKITRKIKILISDSVFSPAIFGIFRPVIILPAAMLTGLEPDYLRAVLAHELSHIKRYDYLINTIQKIFEALLFFNPAVWLIGRSIRREREALCDADAAVVSGSNYKYASILSDIAERLLNNKSWSQQEASVNPEPALAEKDNPGELSGRVERLLKKNPASSYKVSLFGLSAIFTLTVFAIIILINSALFSITFAAKILTPEERIKEIEKQNDYFRGYPADKSKSKEKATVNGRIIFEDPLMKPHDIRVFFDDKETSYGFIDCSRDEFVIKINPGIRKFDLMSHSNSFLMKYGPIKLEPGETKEIEFRIPKGRPVNIILKDSDGNKVEDFKPSLCYYIKELKYTTNASFEYFKVSGNIITLNNYNDLPLGVKIIKDGYENCSYPLTFEKNETEKTLIIEKALPFTGHLYSKNTGEPIKGAKVFLFYSVEGNNHISYTPDKKEIAKTDENGKFMFSQFPKDSKHIISVEGDGYEAAVLRDVQAGQTIERIEVNPVKIIHGKFTGNLDRIIFDYTYLFFDYDYSIAPENPTDWKSEFIYRTIKTSIKIKDDVGYFDIPLLYKGSVNISTRDGKYFSYDSEKIPDDFVINLDEDKDTSTSTEKRRVKIELDYPKDQPAPKGNISINITQPGSAKTILSSKEIDLQTGELSFDIDSPAIITVDVKKCTGYFVKYVSHTIEKSKDDYILKLKFEPAGTISGDVFNQDGTPANEFRAELNIMQENKESGFGNGDSENRSSITSDLKSNTFFLNPVCLDGVYRVHITRGSEFIISDEIKVDKKNSTPFISMKFPESKDYALKILDKDRKPLPNVSIGCKVAKKGNDKIGIYLSNQPDNTDANGDIVIKNIYPISGCKYIMSAWQEISPAPERKTMGYLWYLDLDNLNQEIVLDVKNEIFTSIYSGESFVDPVTKLVGARGNKIK